MDSPHQIGAIAATHLNDLQADMEADSRLIDQIHHHAAAIRALLPKQPKQAALIEPLMKQVAEKASARAISFRLTKARMSHVGTRADCE